MNVNVLPIAVMLSHSEQWMRNQELRAKITAHLVGMALLLEVERVHVRLAEQVERRRQLSLEIERLTELITQLDLEHDGIARAIFLAFEALIAAAADAVTAAYYRRLQRLLFPEGLSIVSRSYSYEAGAIAAMERRVTDADLAELAAIPVGKQTIADWYRAWVERGKALGRHVHEREALYAHTARGGSGSENVDIRSARLEWVGTVQTFLGALHLMQLDEQAIERIVGPLDASITQALRGRAGNEPVEEPPGEELPGEEPPAIELPGAELPGDEPGDKPAPVAAVSSAA
jgi:hypothetical protein